MDRTSVLTNRIQGKVLAFETDAVQLNDVVMSEFRQSLGFFDELHWIQFVWSQRFDGHQLLLIQTTCKENERVKGASQLVTEFNVSPVVLDNN